MDARQIASNENMRASMSTRPNGDHSNTNGDTRKLIVATTTPALIHPLSPRPPNEVTLRTLFQVSQDIAVSEIAVAAMETRRCAPTDTPITSVNRPLSRGNRGP
jgi:hypothetical protein